MTATDSRADAAQDASRRLDVELFDTLTSARLAHTIDEKAALVGMHRSTLFRLRNGQIDLGVDRALIMAESLGVTVEQLFPAPNRRAA